MKLLKAAREHVRSGRDSAAFEGARGAIGWTEAFDLMIRGTDAVLSAYRDGRPVGIALDHSPASAMLLVAFLQSGVPAIPLPPFFSPSQRADALRHAGCQALITAASIENGSIRWVADTLDHEAVELPAGTAVISYSSGSTGTPKGVCLSADHLTAVASSVVDFIGADRADRHLAVLPFGILLEHVAGLFASLIAGGTYIALPGSAVGLSSPMQPEPAALLAAITDQRATSLILVPEYLALLVGVMESSGTVLPALDLVAVGGARLSPDLISRARAVGLPVRQGYGLTETGSVLTLEAALDGPPGGVGRSIGTHRLSLAADGEILVDGPVFLGTVGQPRSPGPFATGDLGRIDDDGQYWIEGRKSNLIVTSFGRNISPEWIEGLMVEQPEIAQAMVRGEGKASLEALIVPACPTADLDAAVRRVNAMLPDYARVGDVTAVPPFTPANGLLTGNGRLRRAAIDALHSKKGPDVAFFNRLVAETREAQARFAVTPQLVAGLTGRISRADYLSYLAQAYHHVRHTVPLMQEARALLKARGDTQLVEALDDYILEETGHEQWILDDINAAGGNGDAVAVSDPAPATKAMTDFAYHTIRTGNPAAFFGMVFVLEGTSIAMATAGAGAVQQALGLPSSAFRYLNSHGSLDQEHMVFFEKLMNRIADAADQAAIVAMARTMFGLFGEVFGTIELEAKRVAA